MWECFVDLMETALTKVVPYIIMAADAGAVFLDLSAAFDTVDHKIILMWLQRSHSITGGALNSLKSYLEGRYQSVKYDTLVSPSILIFHRVPQKSVLSPLLFLLYTCDIILCTCTLVLSLQCICYIAYIICAAFRSCVL